ncbi:AraC family transcriptional regulator [Xylanibacter brevis]|uniref:AraC family transcriptional regulator n=1 Tax=Xylanibacter brevis TaxID=83231 RepID=UPI0004806272|nr:substrate-binding domain-containing protein [Xylanibacter brevis]
MKKLFLSLICFALFMMSCSERQTKYRVGISQCSEDIWRDKQNYELQMGTYFHNNVELKFAAAHDNDERQVQQIDSLVNEGIDLLIVAPNQVQTISPAIDRAYDKGIPVIVSERKTNSRKYTAFIGADNYEMGRVMGEYIISCLHGRGSVLEIKGLEGSSPAIERHNGFIDALKNAPQIKLLASLQGDWTEETGYKTTRQWMANHPNEHVDLVFGANDRTAMGARKALGSKVLYCGIDGLQGQGGGIQLVRDSLLEASYIYPTHGDQLIDLAVKILEGQPYEKETMMMSALVTHDNAKVLLMQNEELMRQTHRLDQIHQKADSYLQKLNTQHVINWLAIGVIVLLLLVIVLSYLQHLHKVAIQRERVTNTLWNMEPIAPVAEQQTPADVVKEQGTDAGPVEGSFISHFREVVETRLEDSDLSVDDLASAMSLSRVQLYRKVKAITGASPVELLRTARLNRAYQILLTTDKSVSEVAYAVGFTAPSYFTKCFKEAYGMVPGDVRK